MNLLVDSHALLWWFASPQQLSAPAREALRSSRNQVYVSAAVAWEISIKVKLGKLDAKRLVSNFASALAEQRFRRLAISVDHAIRAGNLPWHHRDPFDRMLVAQAQSLGLPIVSADTTLDRYGITRIW